jgi:hypothetical protein
MNVDSGIAARAPVDVKGKPIEAREGETYQAIAIVTALDGGRALSQDLVGSAGALG